MIQETLIPRLCTLCTTVPVIAPKERLRGYRSYVYEADAVDRSATGQRKVIKRVVVEKERKKSLKSAAAFKSATAALAQITLRAIFSSDFQLLPDGLSLIESIPVVQEILRPSKSGRLWAHR